MGMTDNGFIIPICIHSMLKLINIGNNDYSGIMSILQKIDYNNTTVELEWLKIMELRGYETGLVIDTSGVAENFMNTIYTNCYKKIQLK